MRVLILGGTRFIGRRITAALMARGDDVTVVHRAQAGQPDQAGLAVALPLRPSARCERPPGRR
ncbi:MAG: NAD-dependent epimerase/dehydratase family protein [Streptosporangiaceae bacterium]